jgi:methylglutaconyl-CoA hydratase
MTPEIMEETAVRIATIRSEPEAREGLEAFLEKRPASWVPQR